jgi:hypothetical protein
MKISQATLYTRPSTRALRPGYALAPGGRLPARRRPLRRIYGTAGRG